MSNFCEWVDFAELCRRVPGKSPRTLRRYIAARIISHRQLVRRGRIEFNWRTVERELAALETQSTGAPAGELKVERSSLSELTTEIRALRALIESSLLRPV